MKRALLLVLAVLLALWQISSSPKPVEILHAPHILTDDSDVIFDVRAIANSENRLLVIAAVDDVGDTVRRSDEELDESSQVTRQIRWLPFDAGDYELIARVYGTGDSPLAQDRSHLQVLEWRGAQQ